MGELLAFVRRGDVEAVHSLRRGARPRRWKPSCAATHKTCKHGRPPPRRRWACPRAPSMGAHRARAAQTCRRQRSWRPTHAKPQVIIAHHDTLVQTQRPCDRVCAASKRMVRAGGKAVPGQRHVHVLGGSATHGRTRRSLHWSAAWWCCLPLLMLVPMACSRCADHDAGRRRPFVIATVRDRWPAGLLHEPAARGAFGASLQPRDGFVLVGHDLVGAAAVWCPAAVAGGARPQRHQCVLRGHVRLHRHRRHGNQPGWTTLPLSGERVALLHDVGGRFGHHRAGGGDPAACWVWAARSCTRPKSAGPMKDQKLTPRIADTARVIWGTYFAAVAGLFCGLPRAAGMSWMDAFLHMCSTVSLGGFSSHDASFGHLELGG